MFSCRKISKNPRPLKILYMAKRLPGAPDYGTEKNLVQIPNYFGRGVFIIMIKEPPRDKGGVKYNSLGIRKIITNY